MKIWTVDTFTIQAYSGNPAAVMIVENFPKDKLCQQIASEMNLSETAFVKPLAQDHFHIRWFTPTVEVKLCGHATLAAAHILYQNKLAQGDKILLESLSGPLSVYKNAVALTLDFPLQPVSASLDRHIFEGIIEGNIIAAAKALDDIILEFPSETAVRNFHPIIEKINTIDCRGLIITAAADQKYDFVSRFFGPRVGVSEDPVTGSAHCKLADYWQKKLNKTEFLAYQASPRGGEITLSIRGSRVLLTGNAVTILEANWLAALSSTEEEAGETKTNSNIF